MGTKMTPLSEAIAKFGGRSFHYRLSTMAAELENIQGRLEIVIGAVPPSDLRDRLLDHAVRLGDLIRGMKKTGE
jgi:hypothetical protein